MPAVSVIEKGSKNGTVTNAEGEYSIEVSEGAILIFRTIGYITKEVKVGEKTVINVKMLQDIKKFGELVVVGYGTKKKKTLTGSIVNVKGEILKKSPSISLSNSLAGRLPGVIALNRSGEPGQDVAQLLIRGKSTLGFSGPLIVIDGVPGRGGLNQIDPRDIESISVLKDASAAIYGARAANGVIIVTTKRGTIGKPVISYAFNQGVSIPTRIPEFASSAELATFQNEQLVANGQPKKFTPDEIEKFRNGTDPLNYPNTDWTEVALKDMSTQSEHSLSVRGGSNVVKYYLSGNISNQEGIFRNGITDFKVLGGRSNVDVNITDNFKVSLDLSFQQQNRTYPGISTSNLIKTIWRNYPYLVDVYPNGLPGDGVERGDNPLLMASEAAGYRKNKTNLYFTKLSFDYEVSQVKGLGIDGFIAYDKTYDFNKIFRKPYSVYSYDKNSDTYIEKGARFYDKPELSERYDYLKNFIGNIKIKYKKSFNNNSISAFVAMEFAENKTNFFSAMRRNFISTAVDQLYAGNENNQVTDGSASEFSRKNYFGRISYQFKNTYLLDLNFRYDGSSAFSEDNRWGFFPGLSVGWRISEEEFIKRNLSFINNLKIRASWGQMGNDAIDPFQYLQTYSFTNGVFLGEQKSLNKGIVRGVAPNPDITWETATTMNIGLDVGLWNDLLGMTLDIFKTKRSDILVQRNASIPVFTGLNLPLENIGIVENKGFEIELWHKNNIGNFSYSIRPNFAFARNKIINIDEAAGILEWQRRTGHPMGSDLYYIPIGIYRSQDEIEKTPHPAGTVINDLQYKDVNDDGAINDKDKVRLNKTSTPEITFGMSLLLGYGNFDLSVLFQGAANSWRYYWFPQGLFGNVLQEMFENRPTPDNPDSKYPNLTYDDSQVSALPSEFWLEDASYLRLKNIELGYSLSENILSKFGINGLRFYLNGFNLLTFDKLKWFDPEGDSNRGYFYPQNKVFNIGINLTF